MREGFEVYQMYLEDCVPDIEAGKDVVLEVRDLAEFSRKVVRAKIARNLDDLPDCQQLWVRNLKDEVTDECWAIKVVEELPDDAFQPKRVPERRSVY